MATTIFRGDAPAVAQVWKVTPANVESGDIFTLTINGKSISVTAGSDDIDTLCASLVTQWNLSEYPEFQEITADSTAGNGYLTLTADTPGKSFIVTASTTNSSTSASVTIEETTKGVAPVNEKQTITLDATYSGGTFTLTVDLGSGDETTGTIAYNASAATVQAALEGLASVSSGDVLVTGTAGGPWVVEWKGSFAATEVNPISVDGSSLTGTNAVNVATVQNGFGGGDATYLLSTVALTSQSGTYTLTVAGQTTAAIAYNATPAAVQSAIEALSSVGSGNVTVNGFVSVNTGAPGGVYVIRFTEDFAGLDVTMTLNDLNLAKSADLDQLIVGGVASWPEVQIWDLGGTTGTPSGTDVWKFSNSGTTSNYSGTGFAFLDTTGVAQDYADPVTYAGSYQSTAIQSIKTLYGSSTTADDITVRHFVAGGGFVTIFDGTSEIGTDYDEGQIGTSGVGSSLDHAAAVTTVIDGGSGTQNEQQSVHVEGSGGTFTLTYDGQTTAAIAFGAAAGTVETNLEALSNIDAVSVSGTGTGVDPYIVEFQGTLASTNVDEMTGDGTSLTGGSGTVTESQSHVAAVDEVQTITLDAGVSGGTFTLTYDGETTAAIAYNASAATVETELEALSNIPGVSVSGSAGGPWAVTFDTTTVSGTDISLLTADSSNLTGGTGTQTLTLAELTRNQGPDVWNDPKNWTQGIVPEWDDQVVIESSSNDIAYGLKQWAEFTADNTTEYLSITDHDFVDEQRVRVSNTGGSLPTGLSASTDYYVIYVDKDTIQLSATRGGSAVNFTTDGTGTHKVGVALRSFEHLARSSSKIGLPERNEDGDYYEYRERYLKILINDEGSNLVQIGEGDGTSAQRINLDFDDSQLDLLIFQTGSNSDPGVPALLVKNTNASTLGEFLEGELGLAFYRGETTQFSKVTQRGGLLVCGPGHVNGNMIKTGGSRLMMGTSVNGTLTESL